eukprot:SAG11_NODE_24046_length_379_cov_0.546429_1_plen_75_part_10
MRSDLAKWGGENTTEAMGDILQLFDEREAECRARGAAVGQRYEPGAPLVALTDAPLQSSEPLSPIAAARRAPWLG